MLVKLTDNKITCLTDLVVNITSLTYPVKVKIRDDSHHNFRCFSFSFVKIRFFLDYNLLLLLLLTVKFSNVVRILKFTNISYVL